MRLTLRTLLAYLDDRLSPANAREIGQKIAKSPFATELEDRIKSVVRRRRLAKHSVAHKTIDPNLIAEYLDDQLTPELVALIEKEILSSDGSLAEVAAAHQILGLLSDPVELSQSLKERLYKMNPASGGESDQELSAAQPESSSGEWKPLAPQATSHRRSPMLLLGGMVLGWLVLLATDAHLFQPAEKIADEIGGKAAEITALADTDEQKQQDLEVNVANGDAGETAITDSEMSVADGTSAEQLLSGDADAVVDSEASEMVVPDQSVAPADSATPEAAASTALNTDSGNTAVEDSTSPASASDTANVTFHVVDSSSMIVLGDVEKNSWVWGTSTDGADAQSWTQRLRGVVAGIAEPFEAGISSPENGWTAQVLGSSLFEAINGGKPGIALLDGRLLVRQTVSLNKPVSFRLYTGSTSLVIELPMDGSQVAIGIAQTTIIPEGAGASDFEMLPVVESATVAIFAPDANVSVTVDPEVEPVDVGKGYHLVWRADSGEPPVVSSTPPIPAWIFDAAKPKPDSTVELIAEIAAEFRKSPTVADAATEVMENLNPQVASYAVKLPALLRNVSDLTAALLQSDVTSVRTEAIRGLRTIAQQSVGGRMQIAESLQTRIPEAELENVMTLLNGLTPTAVEERATSEWLVEMLSNNRPAIRELAIFNLEQLTGERNNFFADDDVSRRESAVRRWHKLLERNDGRLLTPHN